jgi:MFS family permease
VLGVLLANTQNLLAIQFLYLVFPFMASLFFNSYQIFMLGVSTDDQRPLAVTAGHFTLSWSLGFALGPLISANLVSLFNWQQVYYLASILAGLVGLILLGFNPQRKIPSETKAEKVQGCKNFQPAEPNFVVPAWIGLLFGLSVWSVVTVYWPVQAVQLGVSASQKGLPEFVSAITQGLTALALTYVACWYLKPAWIAALGSLGVMGLLVIAVFDGFATFPLGTFLYGIFTGSMFSLMVYHAMQVESLAVRRVAINETLVGTAFLLAYPLSALFHPEGTSFNQSYLMLAVFLAIGIAVQAWLILRILGRIPSWKMRREKA